MHVGCRVYTALGSPPILKASHSRTNHKRQFPESKTSHSRTNIIAQIYKGIDTKRGLSEKVALGFRVETALGRPPILTAMFAGT